jgi:hypothetical protein
VAPANSLTNLSDGLSGVFTRNVTAGTDSSWRSTAEPWESSNLIANKEYSFTAKSRNADGVETAEAAASTWTSIEPVAGLTFPQTTCSSIQVAPAGTFTGLSSGVSGIRMENKTAATATLWQPNSTPWNSTGLNPNAEYTFAAKSRNAVGTETSERVASVWTQAAVPNAPAIDDVSSHSMSVAIDTYDGNPTDTQYAIYCVTTRQYVKADGALGAGAVWQTAAEWGTTTIQNLNLWKTYTCQVKARNTPGQETPLGPAAGAMTFTDIPARVKGWSDYN